MSRSLLGLATKAQRPNLHYPIVDPSTGRSYSPPPDTGWRYAPDRMQKLINTGSVLFPAKPDGRPREKKFRADLQTEFVAFASIIDDVYTGDGTAEIRALFGEEVFDFSKPSALMARLVKQGAGDEGIVLDFFAGSGSTAHAVLGLNGQDGGTRKFILVQLPEATDREDYPTIAEITKERVRRVIKGFEETEVAQLDLEGRGRQDRGFRVFKLAESNFTPWNAEVMHDTPALEKQLELHVDHVVPGRMPDDLLFEILLKSGFELATPFEMLQLAGTPVYSVAGGALLVCLERELTLDLIRAIAQQKPQRVVCLDEGFAGNDQLKANAVQIFRRQGVTTFRTV